MKKILLLGGSAQQIVAIKTAQKLGYYTVLCDYLPDNPGQYEADKFYLISTTDKEAILKVALDECVDGVLAYASDPAAPTAAYVAEKMKLPTNPYEAVMTLCNKDCFRHFLKNNGFNKLGIRFGSVNVELVVDKNNKVWPIDIGPRAGGNMIPDLLGMIFGVDVVEMAVLVAMGEKIEEKINKGIPS